MQRFGVLRTNFKLLCWGGGYAVETTDPSIRCGEAGRLSVAFRRADLVDFSVHSH